MKCYLRNLLYLLILFFFGISNTSCRAQIKAHLENSNVNEPSSFDVFWHSLVSKTILAGFYNDYVDKIQLTGNEQIMDFGSGWGTMAGLLSQKLTLGGTVTCLDISDVWIKASQKKLNKYSNIKYLTGDITKIAIPDSSFDAIVIHFVLHDIDSSLHKAIIEKQIKILKPGGRIYIREPLLSTNCVSEKYINYLFSLSGLQKEKSEITNSFFMGEMIESIYRKKK